MEFIELPRDHISEAHWGLAVRAVREATADLELPHQPAIRWFDDGGRAVKSWPYGTVEQDTDRPDGLMGISHAYPDSIWVRNGQSKSEMLTTLFHEAYHLADPSLDVTGRMDARAKAAERERREAAAEAYGKTMAERFLTRPMATKSLRLPLVTMVPRDDVHSIEAIAGVDDGTDLGDGMWERRPVVVSGIAGLPKGPIGHVKTLEVLDDGEVWAKAQLAKAEAYRRYVQRLIEQGAIEASAMVPSHLVRRNGRRLTSMPVAGLELRPVAA